MGVLERVWYRDKDWKLHWLRQGAEVPEGWTRGSFLATNKKGYDFINNGYNWNTTWNYRNKKDGESDC